MAFVNRMGALLKEADGLRKAGKHEEAIARYRELSDRAIREAPTEMDGLAYYAFARGGIGFSLSEQQRFAEALVEFEAAEQAYARRQDTNSRQSAAGMRGKTLLDMGRLEEGLAILEALKKEGFKHGDYQIQRARQLIAQREEAGRQRRAVAEQALARGAELEQAGNWAEALQVYQAALAALQPNFDITLAGRAIDAAQHLSPPPAIPEEARRHAIYGQTAIKDARQPGDYNLAVAEYTKALALAPWWADIYVNASLALEQLGKPDIALEALKLYLRAAPNAPDAQAIQAKMYELEFRMQRKQ